MLGWIECNGWWWSEWKGLVDESAVGNGGIVDESAVGNGELVDESAVVDDSGLDEKSLQNGCRWWLGRVGTRVVTELGDGRLGLLVNTCILL